MEKGRPTLYTPELGEKICEITATSSMSLKTICADLELEPRTVLRWLCDETKKEFCQMYTRAKEEQADFLAEELIEIADDGTNDYMTITKGDTSYNVEDKEVTSRSKLRVEARKWVASKLKPRKYSDKIDVTSDGEKVNNPATVDALIALANKLNS